jgi:hypothetical protein
LYLPIIEAFEFIPDFHREQCIGPVANQLAGKDEIEKEIPYPRLGFIRSYSDRFEDFPLKVDPDTRGRYTNF